MTISANTKSLSVSNYKSLKEYRAENELAVISAVNKELQNSELYSNHFELSKKDVSIRNILNSMAKCSHKSRCEYVAEQAGELLYSQPELSQEAALNKALSSLLLQLSTLIFDRVKSVFGLNENKDIMSIFMDCAVKWHNSSQYRKLSQDELIDAMDLATNSKAGIITYGSFSVQLFCNIMENYLHARRAIIASILKLDDKIQQEYRNSNPTAEDIEKRKQAHKLNVESCADAIENATKLNTRWRRRGKLKMMTSFFCDREVLLELISRGIFDKNVLNCWGSFLSKFANKKLVAGVCTLGLFIHDNKRNADELISGMDFGLALGWNTDFEKLKEQYLNYNDRQLQKFINQRKCFLEIAKQEFVHNLYWTKIADYTDPSQIKIGKEIFYTLSEPQKIAENWVDFCHASLINTDENADLAISAVRNNLEYHIYEADFDECNAFLLSKLLSSPFGKYTGDGLANFLIRHINEFANNIYLYKNKS
jgi:hypothetical protein